MTEERQEKWFLVEIELTSSERNDLVFKLQKATQNMILHHPYFTDSLKQFKDKHRM